METTSSTKPRTKSTPGVGQPFTMDRLLDGRVRSFDYEIDGDRRLRVRVDEARSLLLVRGAVPGSKNGHVVVRPAIKARAGKAGAAASAKKGA